MTFLLLRQRGQELLKSYELKRRASAMKAMISSVLTPRSTLSTSRDDVPVVSSYAGFYPFTARAKSSRLGRVVISDRVYHYHPLVRAFLRRTDRKDETVWRALHCSVATDYLQQGDLERSIHNHIHAGDFEAATYQLTAIAPAICRQGVGS